MAEGHVFFVEKGADEDGVIDSDMVWQDTYTEIVAYEENIEDNSQLNVVYVTDDNISTNEHYVSAVEEDSSQYYSVMETSGDTSVVEQSDETSKVIEECVNTSEITLTDEPNISVIEYPSETIIPDDSVKTEHVSVSSEKVESEIVENAEDDDQVTLYKIEDSNELFAVQIARDADGKIHKYQYKVRQNEDGQLEAVPGTIQIQPEGTEQLICEEQDNKECIAEQQFTEEPLIETAEPSLEELNNCKTEDMDYELKSEVTEEIIPEVTEEVPPSNLYENQEPTGPEMDIESHYEEEVVDETHKQENIENNVEYLKEEGQQDIPVEQITEETYYDETEDLEEFTNVEYLQEDFEDEEENQQNFENLDSIVEKNKENTIVEENVEHPIEQSLVVQKKYSEGSQVQVISDVVLNENHENNNSNAMKQKPFVINNNTSPKQILNKITDLTFLNENIELKQIPNPMANKSNKLTFLIVTQPVIPPQPEQQKPTIPIQRTVPIQPSKKFRSILRQSIPGAKTHTQFPKNNTFAKNDREKSEHSQSQNTKMLLFNNVVVNKPISQTPLYNKGVRQPRKQVITPVNRVGSEIIIQVPEEKQMTVETLDLDDISDTDYTPKYKTKIKKVYHKKRGRKPAWAKPEIVTTEHESTSKSNVENDAESIKKDKPPTELKEKPQTIQETQEPQQATTVKLETPPDKSPSQPKYTLPPKKRGPGRPKLSERKHNFIEQEIIEHAKTENGTPNSLRKRGRPKLIRTQRKYMNSKVTSSSKVSESKENKESPSKTPGGENITPRRRGRPPKKHLTPTVVDVKKEETTKSTNETIKPEISKTQFSSDSETDIKPTVKKQKLDTTIDKQMDSIINEMEGIHGGSCDDEDVPMIEERLESDVDDDENDKKETLLSILETPNETSAAPVTVTTAPDKEDVLTRALKDANILIQSDDGEEIVGGATQNAQVPFLEPVKPKDDEYDKNLLKSASTTDEKKQVVETKSIDVKKMSQIYKCVKCSKTFSKYIDLKTHMQDHNLLIKGKFKCNKCPQIFTLESALRIHERNHNLKKESGTSSGDAKTSKSGRFKCVQCSRSFSTVSLLRAHQQSHKNFKCDRCSELFNTRNQLLMHIRGHIKDNLLKTTLIASSNFSRKLRKSTQDKTEFSEIIRNVEKNLKPRKTLTRSPQTSANNKGRINTDLTLQNIHRCNVCSKTFRQLAHLVMHREVHNKPTCVNCGKVFSFKHSLNEHMRRYCLKSSSSKTRKSYEIKRKSFNTQDTVNRFKRQTIHNAMSSNNITSSYKCKHCDKIFRTELFCNKHMKTHEQTATIPKSVQHQTLNNNNATNTNNEPIIKKCYIPLVMTNLTHASSQAKQKNSGNQTNTTKVSSQQTTTKRATICNSSNTLSAPISERRQSDRKQVPSKKVMPIRCEMCNLSFTTYTGLFRHTRTHPDITEKCNFCNSGFETKELLKKHLIVDHSMTQCEQCKETFKTMDELSEHRLKSGHDMMIRSPQIEANLVTTVKKLNSQKRPTHSGIPFQLKTQKKQLIRRKL